MRTVSIRELKSSLSAHLREVQRGEEIVVTSRGKEVARILPAQSAQSRSATEADAIAALRAQPWLRPSSAKRALPALTLPWPKRARSLSELVLADRE
jgi:prevent-host-death family protein